MNRILSGAIAALLLSAPLAQAAAVATIPAVSAAPAQRQLMALADDYYDAAARYNPVYATVFGNKRYDDLLGMAIAPAVRARQFALYRQFGQRLQAIKRARLSRADRTNYDILDYEIKDFLASEPFPAHLLPVEQMANLPVVMANFAGGVSSQAIGTVREYEAYLSRLQQLPAWIDQAIVNMREGMRVGVVLPKANIISMLPQFKKLAGAATPEASVYYSSINKLPAGFSEADKQRLTAAYRDTIATQLLPALNRLAQFVENDYLAAGRASSGIGALPNGKRWYQYQVATSTTTSLTPAAVHALGLKEVARIQQQFAALGPKLGYTGPAAGLPAWVAAQPQFYPFKSEAEVLAVYEKLNVELDSKLAPLFDLVPKARLEVRPEPELSRATAADHYTPPAPDGSRPGVYWAVVNDTAKYNNARMTSLFLHEGKPGHHFHLALTQELGLPDFRKFGGNNAYVEGWALYAESLGNEMKMFEDPGQYFGHLNLELWRAVRLVVDTGLHDQGWSREQAIQYMRDTVGFEALAIAETERYMVWPGQALGYKIGQLKIMELRQRAAAALGPKFSLPKFHAVVLGDGTLPLKLLEAQVDQWIAEQK